MTLPRTIHLNIYNQHLSYISKSFVLKFQCSQCELLFNHGGHFKQHVLVCHAGTKNCYPGGFYSHKYSIFQTLEDFGIHVPENDRFHKYFSVFDMESILKPINEAADSNSERSHEHIPSV